MRRMLRPMGRTSISTPVLSGSSGVGQAEAPAPAGEEHLDEVREVVVDVGVGGGEGRHDLLVERADRLLELAPRVAHVAHLGVELAVALLERGELLERPRVDRARADVMRASSSATRASRLTPSGSSTGPAAIDAGFDAQVAARSPRRGWPSSPPARPARSRRRRARVGHLAESRLGAAALATDLLEALGPGALRLELLAVRRVHAPSWARADVLGRRGARATSRRAEGRQVELERLAPPGGLVALVAAPARRASISRARASSRRRRSARPGPRGATTRSPRARRPAARARRVRRPRARRRPRRPRASLDRRRDLGLERRALGARRRSASPASSSASARPAASALLVAARPRSAAAVASRASTVRDRAPAALAAARAPRAPPRGRVACGSRAASTAEAASAAAASASSTVARVTSARPERDAPARRREAVAVARDDDQVGVRRSRRRCPLRSPGRDHGAREQDVQHARDVRAARRVARAPSERSAIGPGGAATGARRRPRRRAGSRPAPPLAAQGLEAPRGSGAARRRPSRRPPRRPRTRRRRSAPASTSTRSQERAEHAVEVPRMARPPAPESSSSARASASARAWVRAARSAASRHASSAWVGGHVRAMSARSSRRRARPGPRASISSAARALVEQFAPTRLRPRLAPRSRNARRLVARRSASRSDASERSTRATRSARSGQRGLGVLFGTSPHWSVEGERRRRRVRRARLPASTQVVGQRGPRRSPAPPGQRPRARRRPRGWR